MKKANFNYPYNGLERLSGMGQEFKNNMHPLFRIHCILHVLQQQKRESMAV